MNTLCTDTTYYAIRGQYSRYQATGVKGTLLKNEFESFYFTCTILIDCIILADFRPYKVVIHSLFQCLNRSNHDYKKYVQKKNLSEDFISWHRTYNNYDYELYKDPII